MTSKKDEAARPGLSRSKYIFASIMINLCLGAVYAFSILVPPLEAEFGWKRIETSPAFTIALLTFALSMVPAGKLLDRKGPRFVATVGGVLLGLGMILSSYTDSLTWLYLSYGFIVGLGIGFAYGAPIATCNKWFPDKKGLATGLVVFGFGGGSIIFAPLWTSLIESFGWRYTFTLTGILFTVLTVSPAQILRNPPEDYRPGAKALASASKAKRDLKPTEMIQTSKFYLLWISYLFGTTAGLMIIGQAKMMAMELANIDSLQASFAVSILGGFNALGRIMWGYIGDKAGRETTLSATFLTCTVSLLLISTIFEPAIFIAGLCLIGLCFGGFLALYPSLTSDHYGSRNMGINYGLLFTAYGGGSILGPTLASYTRTYNGSYLPALYASAFLALLGTILALVLKMRIKTELDKKSQEDRQT
ncbi:MAG: OFA family MFS transporter [Nitrososphaerota archaeon]|nr:OFA family MFS transporter [Candidatus Bathyarchaeota archaeon]MDW8048949.1 OFA family MFS transporter [Nitrososphaerota archaeon]